MAVGLHANFCMNSIIGFVVTLGAPIVFGSLGFVAVGTLSYLVSLSNDLVFSVRVLCTEE